MTRLTGGEKHITKGMKGRDLSDLKALLTTMGVKGKGKQDDFTIGIHGLWDAPL